MNGLCQHFKKFDEVTPKVLVAAGDITNGFRTGIWRYYYDNGKLFKLETFENTDSNKPTVRFFNNGCFKELRLTNSSLPSSFSIGMFPEGKIDFLEKENFDQIGEKSRANFAENGQIIYSALTTTLSEDSDTHICKVKSYDNNSIFFFH